MVPVLLLVGVVQGGVVSTQWGEAHRSTVRQPAVGREHAAAYFAVSRRLLICERQRPADQCDQPHVIGVDESGVRQVSSGCSPTSCRYFHEVLRETDILIADWGERP